jgi:CubicO group peptidase (beta-lactamase class C family)
MEVPTLHAPPTTADQRDRFASAYRLLDDAVQRHTFPGCSFAVLFADEVVALDAVGRFTYDPDSPPATIHTVYDLASLTKVLATTAMAMVLYDRNQISLDEPLGRLLPAFIAGEPAGSQRHRVTLRMLLDHSSGLPGYLPLYQSAHDPDALFEACLKLPLETVPGTRAEYSDLGFILLGRALERAASEAMDTFCRREIFEPLCMDSARFCPPTTWKVAIPPTEDNRPFRGGPVQGVVHDENAYVLGGVAGHAGLFAPAFDCLRFAQGILHHGVGASGKRVFARETVSLFPSRSNQPPGTSRALGWDTPTPPSSAGKYFSPQSIGHLGFTGTSLWIDRETGLAIVLLSNRTWPTRENEAIRELRPQFYDAVAGTLMPALRAVENLRTKVIG